MQICGPPAFHYGGSDITLYPPLTHFVSMSDIRGSHGWIHLNIFTAAILGYPIQFNPSNKWETPPGVLTMFNSLPNFIHLY